jgi:hypothetical protein
MILPSPKYPLYLSVYAALYRSTSSGWTLALLTHENTRDFISSIGLYRAKAKVQGKLWVSREIRYSRAAGPAYYYVL